MVQAVIADPTMRKGQIMRGPWPQEVISRLCEGDLAAGNLVKWGTDRERQALEIPTLPVADVDAIATAAVIASAATVQSIGAATFDGVIGRDRITPCRTLTITFDASADWNTPSGECRVDFYGVDALGAAVKDTISKPNGSGATAYNTEVAFSGCVQVDIEACNGAGGTATIGVGLDRVELSPADYPGIAIYEPIKEPNTTAREYDDEEEVAILTRGRICSVPEHAVSVGDQVYVRVLAAGADLCGQLTGQDGADTPGTYARLVGARWISVAAADGVAVVELAGV